MSHDRSPKKEKKKPKKQHEVPHGPTPHRQEMALLHPRVPPTAEAAAPRTEGKK